MTRQVTLRFDRETYGSWPYQALTAVLGAPKTIHAPSEYLCANGPTEEFAIENLKRIVEEWEGAPEPADYPKTVEVDW